MHIVRELFSIAQAFRNVEIVEELHVSYRFRRFYVSGYTLFDFYQINSIVNWNFKNLHV